jgi:hypothetical protein
VFLLPPYELKRDLLLGIKATAENTPEALIKAVRDGIPAKCPSNIVRVRMRNSVGSYKRVPGTLTAFKASHFWEMSMAANEALAAEQTFPLDMIYPAGTKSTNVASFFNMDLTKWKTKLEIELAKHRVNKRHKAVMPYPVGISRIGENANMMFTENILQHLAQEISVAIGSALDMVMGRMTYSGGNIRLKFLKNIYAVDLGELQRLVDWWADSVCYFRQIAPNKVKIPDFQMADDLQRTQQLIGLYDRKLSSGNTVQQSLELSPEEEQKMMTKEFDDLMMLQELGALKNASIQGRAGVVSAQYGVIGSKIQNDFQMEVQQQQMEMQQQQQAQAQQQQQEAM